jgi:hypothetical protein
MPFASLAAVAVVTGYVAIAMTQGRAATSLELVDGGASLT